VRQWFADSNRDEHPDRNSHSDSDGDTDGNVHTGKRTAGTMDDGNDRTSSEISLRRCV
jgi:hypothetical protein